MQQPYLQTPPPASRRSALPWLLALVGVLVLLCCGASVGVVAYFSDYQEPAEARPGAAGPADPSSGPGGGRATGPTTGPARGRDAYDDAGRGDEAFPLFLPAGTWHTVAFSHEGGGAYAVWARDVDGKRRGLVVNGTGDTEGVWPLDFAGKVAGLDVEADGAWTVAIRPLGPTPELSGGASGDESAVLYVGGSAVALRATVSHRGDGNVVVTAYDERGLRDLLVNDIGQYVGDVVVPAGTVAVAVHANGPWAVRTR